MLDSADLTNIANAVTVGCAQYMDEHIKVWHKPNGTLSKWTPHAVTLMLVSVIGAIGWLLLRLNGMKMTTDELAKFIWGNM